MGTDIKESNKLIADFMGAYIEEKDGRFHGHTPYQFKSGVFTDWHCIMSSRESCEEVVYTTANLFNCSWDWLMVVVEKIELCFDGMVSVDISDEICVITNAFDWEDPLYYQQISVGETKIQAVYNGVVDFVKWYNLRKS